MEISPSRVSNRRCFQPRRPKSLMYAAAKSLTKNLESSPPSAERISMTRFMACSRSMDECNRGFLPRQPRDRPVTQVVFLDTPRFGGDPDQIVMLDRVRSLNITVQRAGRCLVNEVVHGVLLQSYGVILRLRRRMYITVTIVTTFCPLRSRLRGIYQSRPI